jgi:hypothetical protein
MKTSELTGAALDWAVAKCEKLDVDTDIVSGNDEWGAFVDYSEEYCHVHYQPSEHWGWAGPIIERERISIDALYDEVGWVASMEEFMGYQAETPLIAAMRCYVASQLGDEVEIPEELK